MTSNEREWAAGVRYTFHGMTRPASGQARTPSLPQAYWKRPVLRPSDRIPSIGGALVQLVTIEIEKSGYRRAYHSVAPETTSENRLTDKHFRRVYHSRIRLIISITLAPDSRLRAASPHRLSAACDRVTNSLDCFLVQ